jgi:endonuclease/exonuclease/phosphatase family metal-dependent hydrolase
MKWRGGIAEAVDTTPVPTRALSWNLYHGRDRPPDPALFTRRSKLLRITERNATHVQVNRDLQTEFTRVIAGAEWDVALLQECPPRWAGPLAAAAGAVPHRALTSRNRWLALQGALHRWSPDLVGSWEGGSNLTLVRRGADAAGRITARAEVVLRARNPERRVMALTRRDDGLWIGNLHASTRVDPLAVEEILLAAERAVAAAGDAPLILGGDFNVRPHQSPVYDELAERHGLAPVTAPDAIDHLLVRGFEVLEPPVRWPAEAREIPGDGLALRLSDHAPVEALLASTANGVRG